MPKWPWPDRHDSLDTLWTGDSQRTFTVIIIRSSALRFKSKPVWILESQLMLQLDQSQTTWWGYSSNGAESSVMQQLTHLQRRPPTTGLAQHKSTLWRSSLLSMHQPLSWLCVLHSSITRDQAYTIIATDVLVETSYRESTCRVQNHGELDGCESWRVTVDRKHGLLAAFCGSGTLLSTSKQCLWTIAGTSVGWRWTGLIQQQW